MSRFNAIELDELIEKLKKEDDNYKKQVFVNVDDTIYEIQDLYVDDDGDIMLEIGDRV